MSNYGGERVTHLKWKGYPDINMGSGRVPGSKVWGEHTLQNVRLTCFKS